MINPIDELLNSIPKYVSYGVFVRELKNKDGEIYQSFYCCKCKKHLMTGQYCCMKLVDKEIKLK
jgi:hypothetical protein